MILTPLEMLFVNLFVIHKCSKRKYSKPLTFLGLGLSIGVLVYIAFIISSMIPGFGEGNGLFIFSGFIFIIPIKLLYKEPGIKIVTVACFAWIYTFMIFALSVRLGYTLYTLDCDIHTTVLLLQTAIYLPTFIPFYNIIKTKFIVMLDQIGKRESVALMWMTLMWFWTVFIFNLSFAYPGISLFQIITFPTLAVCIVSNFRYIYIHVDSSKTIENLESIAYRDELTQLRTRVILDKDVDDLISRKVAFHLIFFDLNALKSINDRYGHLVGDQYIAFFAHEIKTRIGNRGGFYRIAGDEFVCIFPDEGLAEFLEAINTLPEKLPNSQVKFLGFSYGIATYPQNGHTSEGLLEYADHEMYEMKRLTKLQSQPAP